MTPLFFLGAGFTSSTSSSSESSESDSIIIGASASSPSSLSELTTSILSSSSSRKAYPLIAFSGTLTLLSDRARNNSESLSISYDRNEIVSFDQKFIFGNYFVVDFTKDTNLFGGLYYYQKSIRENKIDYAKNLLESVVSSTNDWNDIASSDSLFKFVSGETQKIGGSFTGIGKNNVLTGTLLAMDPGNDSGILETYNAVVVIKMIERDELDEEKYGEAYDGIRTQLLNTELSRGYTNWISQARKEIEKKDYRSTVY